MSSFLFEQSLAGATRPTPFLTADFLALGDFGGELSFLGAFDLVEKQTPRKKPIQCLMPASLAFDPQAGGAMNEDDARRRFVEVLSARPTRPDKLLVEVGFLHAQCRHARTKLLFFIGSDGKCRHGGRMPIRNR